MLKGEFNTVNTTRSSVLRDSDHAAQTEMDLQDENLRPVNTDNYYKQDATLEEKQALTNYTAEQGGASFIDSQTKALARYDRNAEIRRKREAQDASFRLQIFLLQQDLMQRIEAIQEQNQELLQAKGELQNFIDLIDKGELDLSNPSHLALLTKNSDISVEDAMKMTEQELRDLALQRIASIDTFLDDNHRRLKDLSAHLDLTESNPEVALKDTKVEIENNGSQFANKELERNAVLAEQRTGLVISREDTTGADIVLMAEAAHLSRKEALIEQDKLEQTINQENNFTTFSSAGFNLG